MKSIKFFFFLLYIFRWLRNNSSNFSTKSSIPSVVNSLNGTLDGTHSFKTIASTVDDNSNKLFGTAQCPRIEDIPVIKPLVCKKISHERLSVIQFRENCIITACQDGIVLTWARPEKDKHLF